MGNGNSPEIWEWAEYYCPWCYVAAVRLHKIMPEYQGRMKLRQRAFPLEIYGAVRLIAMSSNWKYGWRPYRSQRQSSSLLKNIGHPLHYPLSKVPGVLSNKAR